MPQCSCAEFCTMSESGRALSKRMELATQHPRVTAAWISTTARVNICAISECACVQLL